MLPGGFTSSRVPKKPDDAPTTRVRPSTSGQKERARIGEQEKKLLKNTAMELIAELAREDMKVARADEKSPSAQEQALLAPIALRKSMKLLYLSHVFSGNDPKEFNGEPTKEQLRMRTNIKIWKSCFGCTKDFSRDPARIPRNLLCGHTICHQCCVNVAWLDRIKCPICFVVNVITEDEKEMSVDMLPINRILLTLAEQISEQERLKSAPTQRNYADDLAIAKLCIGSSKK